MATATAKRKAPSERKDARWTTLWQYINSWADQLLHPKAREGNKRTEYGDGYQQACRDIYQKMKELGL